MTMSNKGATRARDPEPYYKKKAPNRSAGDKNIYFAGSPCLAPTLTTVSIGLWLSFCASYMLP